LNVAKIRGSSIDSVHAGPGFDPDAFEVAVAIFIAGSYSTRPSSAHPRN
jgi:hypothetical protein